jgi:hypothetical protein
MIVNYMVLGEMSVHTLMLLNTSGDFALLFLMNVLGWRRRCHSKNFLNRGTDKITISLSLAEIMATASRIILFIFERIFTALLNVHLC